jgi:pimeloyl-ACP methyl ester carboxylesterase
MEEALLKSFCDGQIFGDLTGSGEVEVVALHGWARSRQDLLAALDGLNAVAVDLPGFGVSPEPPQAWGSDEYADLVAELVSGFSKPQVILGHSLGGRVAVKLASRRPDLVAAMVLTGVPLLRKPGPGTSPPAAFKAGRWAHAHRLISDVRMEKLRKKYGSADYRNANGVMRAVLVRLVNESYEDYLAQIKCPVELIWGSKDSVVPLQVGQDACAMIADCRLNVLEDAGHMTPLSSPKSLNEAVRRLLEASPQ